MASYKIENHCFPGEGIDIIRVKRSCEYNPWKFDKKEFGRRLKSARKRANLSQEELANLVGVNKITISYYETGNREDMNPSISTVYKIARILDVSIDWLCGASYIPDVPKMTDEVYREIYLHMLIDLLDRADKSDEYTFNTRYYKIPRRGLPSALKGELETIDHLHFQKRINNEEYESKKVEVWRSYSDYTIEDALDSVFDKKKEYSMVSKD